MSAKQSPHEEYDRGFSNGWDACASRALPAQAGQVLTEHDVHVMAHQIVMSQPRFFALQNRVPVGEELNPFAVELARAIEQAVRAKRAPMTNEQITHAMRGSDPRTLTGNLFFDGIRTAERHHGIVGEKGGA